MQEIMQSDDRIDDLTGYQVKDLTVRYIIMSQIQRKFGSRKGGWKTVEEIKDKLVDGSAEQVRMVVLENYSPSAAVREEASCIKGDKFIDAAFYTLTKDGVDVSQSRNKLKSVLRGCMGMPRSSVVRKGLGRHGI